MENDKIQKFKCYILDDFQTLCKSSNLQLAYRRFRLLRSPQRNPKTSLYLPTSALKWLPRISEELWGEVIYFFVITKSYLKNKKKKKNIRSNEKSCISVQSSVNRVEPKIVVKMKVYIRKWRKLWKFRCRFYFILGTFFFIKIEVYRFGLVIDRTVRVRSNLKVRWGSVVGSIEPPKF